MTPASAETRSSGRPSSSSRLIDRIRRELPEVDLSEDVVFVRLRPGRWQRAAGAWSWVIEDGCCHELCASPDRVSDLLRAPALQVYLPHYSIVPEILPKES